MQITKTATSILIEFTDQDSAILEDSLLDPLAWFETLASEKLANCKDRLKDYWLDKFDKDKSVEFIPTNEAALLSLIFSHKDYKNRDARDKEEKDKLKAG